MKYALVLTLLITIIHSCKEKKEKILLGEWKISNASLYCNETETHDYKGHPELGILSQSGSDFLKGIIDKDIKHGEKFEFYEGDKFYYEPRSVSPCNGTYELKNDTLICKNENQVIMFYYKLNFIDKNKFEYHYSSRTAEGSPNHKHDYTYYYDKVIK